MIGPSLLETYQAMQLHPFRSVKADSRLSTRIHEDGKYMWVLGATKVDVEAEFYLFTWGKRRIAHLKHDLEYKRVICESLTGVPCIRRWGLRAARTRGHWNIRDCPEEHLPLRQRTSRKPAPLAGPPCPLSTHYGQRGLALDGRQ